MPSPHREHGHVARGGGGDGAERSLRWLGIEWDGETRFQLDGAERCRTEAERLVAEDKAYEDDGATRIRMPDEGIVAWEDAVKGRIEFPAEQLEDMVIVRSDGRPTYNFANPVDDWVDGITHDRDQHAKQLVVMRALGAEPPTYAHVPNVFGEDGRKLSKRHGAVSIDEFREAGYLAAALMNFLALLGWAPDGETTIMSREELIERFTLERVGVSPATFDYAKLDWMNGVYLRRSTTRPSDEVVRYMRDRGTEWPEDRVRVRAARPGEGVQARRDPRLRGVPVRGRGARPELLDERGAENALAAVDDWSAAELESALKRLCEELGEKPRTIRVAVTGSRVSPGLYESLELLGRDASLERLRRGAGVAASVLDVDGFEQRLQAYAIERSEEARAVRVGEKETSEQAAIVARYAVLFTREQLTRARAAEEEASGAGGGRAAAPHVPGGHRSRSARTRLENALLAARVAWDGEQLPIRSAQAGLAVEPDYARRAALGEAVLAVSSGFNDQRRSLADRHELESDVTGIHEPVARNEAEKGVLLRPILGQSTARESSTGFHAPARALARPPARARARRDPTSAHMAWIRRLSLEATYTKDRSGPSASRPCGLGLDLEAEKGIHGLSRTVPRSRLVPA